MIIMYDNGSDDDDHVKIIILWMQKERLKFIRDKLNESSEQFLCI